MDGINLTNSEWYVLDCLWERSPQTVMELVGGKALDYGDAGYEFELINGLYMRFALWAGDEEFPPSSQILFSDNFPVAFHGEDMTVCGDVSIGTIKALS